MWPISTRINSPMKTMRELLARSPFAKLYDRKTPIAAADLLNDRELPSSEEHDAKLLCVLTDRGSEFCGNPERHEYELYLAHGRALQLADLVAFTFGRLTKGSRR
jgi:hypothetical protein